MAKNGTNRNNDKTDVQKNKQRDREEELVSVVSFLLVPSLASHTLHSSITYQVILIRECKHTLSLPLSFSVSLSRIHSVAKFVDNLYLAKLSLGIIFCQVYENSTGFVSSLAEGCTFGNVLAKTNLAVVIF